MQEKNWEAAENVSDELAISAGAFVQAEMSYFQSAAKAKSAENLYSIGSQVSKSFTSLDNNNIFWGDFSTCKQYFQKKPKSVG